VDFLSERAEPAGSDADAIDATDGGHEHVPYG
jgi:hypothetical protein